MREEFNIPRDAEVPKEGVQDEERKGEAGR
jgi:hypothetical protein